MTHALGFTSSLYVDYISPEGGFYATPYFSFTTYNGATKYKINTPRVKAFSQEHYNCPSLDGMELEDFNTRTGEPGSHWEARIVDSEYMAGISSDDSQLSFLTLSFFEDMGWYKSNYSQSEPWNYGYNAGCDFIEKPCSKATWGRYWCDVIDSTGCTAHLIAGGSCQIITYQDPLPAPYRYFSQSNVGGDSPWNDFCPVIEPYSNLFCHNPDGEAQTSYGEYFGPGGGCFNLKSASYTNGCFATLCTKGSDGLYTLQVRVDDNWLNCPPTGGDLSVDISVFETITVVCPPVEFYCRIIGSSAVNYTFDPTGNIPIPSAPNSPTRGIPFLPDFPIPPDLFPEFEDFQKLLGDWDLWVGSNLFYFLIVLGIVLIIVCVLCMICKK
jgi:hypothetical protein